jgi:hypothetical protein
VRLRKRNLPVPPELAAVVEPILIEIAKRKRKLRG